MWELGLSLPREPPFLSKHNREPGNFGCDTLTEPAVTPSLTSTAQIGVNVLRPLVGLPGLTHIQASTRDYLPARLYVL